jgi:hypothetical protein
MSRPEATHDASDAACQTIQTKPPHDASDSISLINLGIILSPAACSYIVLCSVFVLVNGHFADSRPAGQSLFVRTRRRPPVVSEAKPSPALLAAGANGETVMAKGQVRSNKETRKPKAEKAKPPVSVGSSPFTQVPGKK